MLDCVYRVDYRNSSTSSLSTQTIIQIIGKWGIKKVLAIENYELSKQKRASLESQSLGKEKEENNNARMPTFFNFQGE